MLWRLMLCVVRALALHPRWHTVVARTNWWYTMPALRKNRLATATLRNDYPSRRVTLTLALTLALALTLTLFFTKGGVAIPSFGHFRSGGH